ncbi:MAG TPA: hypothetical protein VK137_06240, partial [Planctomycetaceae bacterium]|nr:hypothetical protein [Planctomycetaceae bacterium]
MKSRSAQSSPVAPRQERRTSNDAVSATNPPAINDVSRAPGTPVAERQGYNEPTQTLSDLFDAIAADQRTLTLAPTNAACSRNREISDGAPLGSEPRGSLTTSATKKRTRNLLVAAALAAVVVLAGIIIKIKHKDGSVTEIKVPDDAEVQVSGDDASRRMAAPGRPAVPNDSTNAAKKNKNNTDKNNKYKTAEGGHPPGDQD